MPRSTAAYLADIVEACDAIDAALRDVDLATYEDSRLIRSSVEREFTIIGEAVTVLGRVSPNLLARIPNARLVIGFRNLLAHDYAAVDDETVFATAAEDLPELRQACSELLRELGAD